MKARRIDENVWWLGAIDWDRRLFDGLIPLPDGTSYNCYFVQGKSKSALIDAVDPSMKGILFERLKDLRVNRLDYVVANHIEQDHSGTIPDLLAAFPEAKVLTSAKGKGLMLDLLDVPEDRIVTVRDGEILDLGEKALQFIYFPWVHWPETMVTWLPQQRILFSCDLFGSHLASSELFGSDESAVLAAAKRYYAEIMMPFRAVIEKNFDLVAKLDSRFIAPSHGPVYRQPEKIIEAYRDWTTGELKNSVVVPYISMHDSTRLMVNHFVESCAERGISVEQFDLTDADIGKLAMSLVDASGLVIGSPMVLGGPHPKAAYAALIANAVRPRLKYVSVIGSYGWGGRLVETIQSLVQNLKAEFIPEVLAKGLPREKEFAALDRLADTLQSRMFSREQPQEQAATTAQQMKKYGCPVCRYVYDPAVGDPAGGIPPGTPFEAIPDNWVCPLCRVAKSMFRPVQEAMGGAAAAGGRNERSRIRSQSL